MSIIRTDNNTVDYTPELTIMNALFTRIAVAAEAIQADVAVIRTRQTAIAASDAAIEADIEVIKNQITAIAATDDAISSTLAGIRSRQNDFIVRAETETLGIFMDSVDDEEHRLSRASIVHALRSTEQLDDVMAEMADPTPLGP